jgi:hypothetical protein
MIKIYLLLEWIVYIAGEEGVYLLQNGGFVFLFSFSFF